MSVGEFHSSGSVAHQESVSGQFQPASGQGDVRRRGDVWATPMTAYPLPKLEVGVWQESAHGSRAFVC